MNIEDHIDCLFGPNVSSIIEHTHTELDDIIYSQTSTRVFSSVFNGLYNNVTAIRNGLAIDTLLWTLDEYEY
jgi:hypothetical protein